MFVRIHHPFRNVNGVKIKQAKLSNFILPEPALAKLRVDIAPGRGTDHVSSLQVINFTSMLPRNCSSSQPQQSLSMQSNSLILLPQQSSSSAASSDKNCGDMGCNHFPKCWTIKQYNEFKAKNDFL